MNFEFIHCEPFDIKTMKDTFYMIFTSSGNIYVCENKLVNKIYYSVNKDFGWSIAEISYFINANRFNAHPIKVYNNVGLLIADYPQVLTR